jgi:hypothetical protein
MEKTGNFGKSRDIFLATTSIPVLEAKQMPVLGYVLVVSLFHHTYVNVYEFHHKIKD